MTKKMYLDDIPLEEAWGRWIAALSAAGRWQALQAETVPLDQAAGRITAEAVWAKLSSPHYHASAMDGYAVRAADTTSADDNRPLRLNVPDQARYVDTGDPMPLWADAVIPIENAQTFTGEPVIEIRAAVAPRQHVRLLGEDMVASELVLPTNHLIRPVDVGALAGSGHSTVRVWRQPRVAVIPTGAELVPAGSPVKAGDIIEYNSLVLAAQVRDWGGHATRYPIIPDDFERIRATVAEAAQTHDLVLLNAGSSAGSEDFSARVVESLGQLLVHGVAVRPGHPVILGMVGEHTPIIGVPGYPVSAALTGEIFVEPTLARWQGREPRALPTLPATLTRKLLSPLGDDDYVRVTVGEVNGQIVATPLTRGAGVITSLVRADGLLIVPRHHEGFNAGTTVNVHLYRTPQEIARTVVAIGSHDLTLDVLAQFLAERGARLASANVGSQGGLVALRRGEAHLAGSHLLDPDSGEYNLPYLKRYLPDTPVVVVTLVGREQGLMVKPGNPTGVRTLADLPHSGVRFVNRQRGAGTRMLFDFELSKLGFQPASITGYEFEEYTHLAVAAAVASDLADVGLGIPAAARALGLDFLPLFHERYDLIIPKAHYTSDKLKPVLDILHDDHFRQAVAALPGYDVRLMGHVVAEL